MQQVRAAYQQLAKSGEPEDALQYLTRIVETKEAERSEEPNRNVERNVGIELSARECMVTEYSAQGRRQEAIQMLDHCEALLLAHANAISAGFLAKDWHQISSLSLELGLPFAALRRADCGLAVDSEFVGLKSQRIEIDIAINRAEADLLDNSLGRLSTLCGGIGLPCSVTWCRCFAVFGSRRYRIYSAAHSQ